MKNCRRLKKVPRYEFGANAISNWGQLSGVDRANTVMQGVGAIGSMIGNATTGGAPTVGGIATGLASGAATGASIGGVPGAIVGGVLGGISSAMGSGGSVNEQTGEYELPSGISGLFGHSKSYIINKASRIKNGIQAKQMSEQTAANYYQQNGYNDLSMSDGGIAPNTMAYLDDGELIRTPDGTIGAIPEEGKPTDSNLVNVPIGTQVLSDKLKVPGTNKTFAEAGKKLMKKSNKKVNNIYAENSQMLNERNNQIAYQELLDMQESMKNKSIKRKKGIPAYAGGIDGINPYGYNRNLTDFKYWDASKNNYTPEYLNWVNNITTQDVQDIYNGKYGDMSTYLGKNRGTVPTVEQARALMTDRKYGDWHKIGQAFVDNRANNTNATMPNRIRPNATRRLLNWTINTPIGNVDTANARSTDYFDYVGDPGKINVNRRLTNSKGRIPNSGNPSGPNLGNYGDLIDNIAAFAGPVANIFSGRPERVDTYTYDPVYGPTDYNIDPLLQQATMSDRITRYNMANINPNTGANMAFGLQSAVNRNRAIAQAYATKNNAENQMAFNNAQIANQWGQQFANARHTAAVEQAQNDATARNIRRQGFGELSTRIQSVNRDRRLTNRDQAMLDAMKPYLEYGMTSQQLTDMYNKLRR